MLKRLLGVGAIIALFTATPVSAATISFDNIDDAGTLTFDAGTGIATGTGILFDLINVFGAPAGDPQYNCVDGAGACSLAFATTAATVNLVVAGTGVALFGTPGGSITLTGQVETLGNVTVSTTNTVLSGAFNGSIFNQLTLNAATGDGALNFQGSDLKDEGFVAELGLTNPFGFLGSVISLSGCATTGNITTCNVDDADLVNENVNPPGDVIPEPGSMLLLGTGLCGLAASVRRRLRRK